mmetsp:Transcript_1516/g.4599  ORF Transcript_1516/g.4599 Transcript_1516/m.4599 type:complete len:438 (+) Transcript_1516:203-1516(+)
MCGIFAYVLHDAEKRRSEVVRVLLNGLHRLEYRGYDSAGLACDGEGPEDPIVFREVGTIEKLEKRVAEMMSTEARLRNDKMLSCHVGIAHTRWATHGHPSRENSHPHASDPDMDFLVVHNGIITNHSVLRDMLASHGVTFTSQTDTETVAKLTKFLYDQLVTENPNLNFPHLTMAVMQQLEGAFAMVFRSKKFPNELVACRLGSPLVVGTKHGDGEGGNQVRVTMVPQAPVRMRANSKSKIIGPAENSTDLGASLRDDVQQELFFSSDASAIVEHTDRVFYMEDNDIVHVENGQLDVYNYHPLGQNGRPAESRVISTLSMQLDSIMRGNFPHFMLKEIYEQPEAIVSTMRGRIKQGGSPGEFEIHLGGVSERLRDIIHGNRIIFIACGSSYHACLATRQVSPEEQGLAGRDCPNAPNCLGLRTTKNLGSSCVPLQSF